jgi:dienelactone hydrolase
MGTIASLVPNWYPFRMKLLALLFTHVAFAQPSPAVLDRVQQSYDPAVQITTTPGGRSFALCATNSIRLAVNDPITKAPGFVQITEYLPHSDSDRTVILLPPTGGENAIDDGYANSLCSSDFRVELIQHWYLDTASSLDMGMHDQGALRALAAVRHTLDFLKPSRSTQVGILGTSVGALSSSLALNFDPRINSAVLIVGGLGMAEIIAASTEQGATALRAARMKAFSFSSQTDYLAALRQHVTIEPADFLGFSGPKKVLAFVGTEDATVPTINQRELVAAYGAESDEYEGDHVHTIVHTFTWDRSRIASFFDKNLR